MLIGELR